MTKEEVIEKLNLYKKNIRTYKEILNNSNVYIPAQCISDMPKALHKFSSTTENQALNVNPELKELWKEINQVNIWLEEMTEEEQFVIEQIYFEKRYINHVINRWSNMGKEYHGNNYWKSKHRDAIKKIISN